MCVTENFLFSLIVFNYWLVTTILVLLNNNKKKGKEKKFQILSLLKDAFFFKSTRFNEVEFDFTS